MRDHLPVFRATPQYTNIIITSMAMMYGGVANSKTIFTTDW